MNSGELYADSRIPLASPRTYLGWTNARTNWFCTVLLTSLTRPAALTKRLFSITLTASLSSRHLALDWSKKYSHHVIGSHSSNSLVESKMRERLTERTERERKNRWSIALETWIGTTSTINYRIISALECLYQKMDYFRCMISNLLGLFDSKPSKKAWNAGLAYAHFTTKGRRSMFAWQVLSPQMAKSISDAPI